MVWTCTLWCWDCLRIYYDPDQDKPEIERWMNSCSFSWRLPSLQKGTVLELWLYVELQKVAIIVAISKFQGCNNFIWILFIYLFFIFRKQSRSKFILWHTWEKCQIDQTPPNPCEICVCLVLFTFFNQRSCREKNKQTKKNSIYGNRNTWDRQLV